MSQDKGVIVTGNIRPVSLNDTYPTHLDVFGKGGLHSVKTEIDLNLISDERRTEGMLSFVTDTNTMYQLIGGISDINWKPIYTYEDQIKFDILCPQDYFLLGNDKSIAEPSLDFLDLRLDFINLRKNLDWYDKYIYKLSSLGKNKIWTGNEFDFPVEVDQIQVSNLPILGAATFPLPLGLGFIPIPNPTFDWFSASDWLMSGPWMPQIYAGSCGGFGANPTDPKTVISSSLAMVQILGARLRKILDNAQILVAKKSVEWTWENQLYSIGNINTNPILKSILKLYNLDPSYDFPKAICLDTLGSGILLNNPDDSSNPLKVSDVLSSKFIVSEGHSDIPNAISLKSLGQGILQNSLDGDLSVVPIVKNEIVIGREESGKVYAGISDVLSSKFIVSEGHSDIPNAISLNSVLGTQIRGLLKLWRNDYGNVNLSIALSGRTVLEDYVSPIDLNTTDAEIRSTIQSEIAAVNAAMEAQLSAITGVGILTELINIMGGMTYVEYELKKFKDNTLGKHFPRIGTKHEYSFLEDSGTFLFDTDLFYDSTGFPYYDYVKPVSSREGLKVCSYNSAFTKEYVNPVSIGIYGYYSPTFDAANYYNGYMFRSTFNNHGSSRSKYHYPADFGLYRIGYQTRGYDSSYLHTFEELFKYNPPSAEDEDKGDNEGTFYFKRQIHMYRDMHFSDGKTADGIPIPFKDDQVANKKYVDDSVRSGGKTYIGTQNQIKIDNNKISLDDEVHLPGAWVQVPVSYTNSNGVDIPLVDKRIMLRFNSTL